MAQLDLVLGIPSGDHALPASSANVRKVKIPKGTRNVIITCEAAIYIEENDAQTKADNAAADTALRHKFGAGSFSYKPRHSGRGAAGLPADRFIYIQGTANDQVIWLTAVLEGS